MPLPRKLSPEQVPYVRGVWARKEKLLRELHDLPTDTQLAKQMLVSINCIRRLKRGETYRQ